MARDLPAEERWCCWERVFEWAAFKRCLNKCSRAFTKSGYSGEARWHSAFSELERTLGAAKASETEEAANGTAKKKFVIRIAGESSPFFGGKRAKL